MEKENKTNKWGIALTAIALALTFGIISSYAFQGTDSNSDNNGQTFEKPGFNQQINHCNKNKKPQMDPQKRELMKQLIENNDYAAFADLVKDTPMAEKITEENFAQFVQMHKYMEEGTFQAAEEVAKELGIQRHKGNKNGNGMRMHFKDNNGDGICDFKDIQKQYERM